ncbi:F0F1 ATP synthase subunit delta [Pseudonocardia sp. CA-107938]|uniref:F0F1 ATP synthase subunit delta n=1 Tax=Pseudonocardia sp. CA-107938 TaxID=3240021 RepID=UPI003D8B610C
MQSASRESLAEATKRLDALVDRATAADLATLGDDLFAVLRLVVSEPALRRHLADPSVPAAARSHLADQLFSGKIGRTALDVLSDIVSARWSRTSDLEDALEALARRAVLGVAEKDGTLDDVEDQLFRFGRILDREPQLGQLLGDRTQPVEGRVGLLKKVLGGEKSKVSAVTATLLEQAVRIPQGRTLDRQAEQLSELAAARRDRYVAHVRTPVRLSAAQEQQLAESLTRVYGRPISLQVELDESILGGLVVKVGDELIDGSVASRIAAARRTLPS